MNRYPGAATTFILTFALLFVLPASLTAWQQRVHYTMDIAMHTKTHSYDGRQRLVYVNNSPDTLRDVYYHLYYEAFRPGSMMDVHDRNLPHGGGLKIGELAPGEQGEIRVGSLSQEGTPLKWRADETILMATLARPLAPGDSTTLEMAWSAQIPRLTRRGGWMSHEGVEYSMSQWYPKLAEYDRSGWHADEYVGREFYGVYGTYDVTIRIAAEYVLGGTGAVVNPSEVGCGYELGSRDTIVRSPASGTGEKIWRFHAENVHDFAWVADREYVHQITSWNGITIHLLRKRSAPFSWNDAGLWTRAVVAYYSNRFGLYSWPQLTVAMAGDGGMEYPQLVMITGYRGAVSLLDVIAHEVGHEWFYGMVGNNETQEAWMDEGFTQFLTMEAERKLFGLGGNPYRGLDRQIYSWNPGPWVDSYSYYQLAIAGYDEPLITFHDWFREDVTSGLVYYKGMLTVRMLEYMMGDSLFDRAMRHYVEAWRYRHPELRDFEKSMEEASGMRLDWFFNQWIGSTKVCDYAMDGVTSDPGTNGFTTTIRMSNRNEIVMPLDILLTYDDGTSAMANVPIDLWKKPGVEFNLPPWRWVARDYATTFATPKRVVRAEIDSSGLLADIDRTNNVARTGIAGIFPPMEAAWFRRWDLRRPMDAYSVRLRPSLFYSQADGAQAGLVADGGYAFDRYNTKLGLYYNFGSRRIDYDLRYRTPIGLLGRLTDISLVATNNDGLEKWEGTLEKEVRPFFWSNPLRARIGLRVGHERLVGRNYPNAVAPWEGGAFNTVGLFGSLGASGHNGSFRLSTSLDGSVGGNRGFAQWQLGGSGSLDAWGLELGSRLFLGITDGNPPAQYLFNAAGADARTMHDNLIQRLAMNAHPDFAARNHLVLPDQGYLYSLAGTDARFGRHLLNAQLSIGGLNPFNRIIRIPFLEDLDLKLYGAGGWIFNRDIHFADLSEVNAEAGVAASLDLVQTFLPSTIADALDSPNPIILSLWLPLYAHSSLLEREGFAYRFAIGVSMSTR